MKSFVLLAGLFLMGLSGCEGEFAGNRPFDLKKLNRPFGMRWTTIEGARYLGVTNTNGGGLASSGSLQFYDLSSDNFVLKEEISLAIPSNVLDFYFDDDLDRLFILDRNENRVLIYELAGGSFVPRKDAKGSPVSIELMGNPISLTEWTRDFTDPTQASYLAILTEGTGSIQFLNRESLDLFDLNDFKELPGAKASPNSIKVQGTQVNQIGALLQMEGRTSRDRLREISGGEAAGRGAGKILAQTTLVQNNPLFVVASFLDEAIFSFRFYDFDNISNLLFNPRTAIRGAKGVKGTKEDGFQGFDRDLANDFYFSLRSNNLIYKVPGSELSRERDSTSKGNTTVLAQDEGGDFEKNISFGGSGVNPAIGRFARLGDLVVNGQGANSGGSATRAWVLGLEDDKLGATQSRVYSVDLGSDSVSEIETFPENTKPQKLIFDPIGLRLIVAATGSDRLYLYDVSGAGFELKSSLENP